jgi:hypothetical protein
MTYGLTSSNSTPAATVKNKTISRISGKQKLGGLFLSQIEIWLNVRSWPQADMRKPPINVRYRRKADIPFCTANVRL